MLFSQAIPVCVDMVDRGYDEDVSTNVVEVYIRYLRNKIPGIKIETVRGVGYRLS